MGETEKDNGPLLDRGREHLLGWGLGGTFKAVRCQSMIKLSGDTADSPAMRLLRLVGFDVN